ncbi:MAG: nicotinate-nucleotide--dimethylbenzimidazole phosphoribosyltransferase [candidate division NC10 bacterium]|nr:nicotinate-nucleotide--dimethylbenzimidazole phosphoribosyltransferase [candidate division NC10 bacterium]
MTLEECLRRIRPLEPWAMEEARRRQGTLTKPPGSLGRLETLSIQLAGIAGDPRPQIGHKAVIVMAADHGVVVEGVSAYPSEVTAQMLANFARGGAAINVLARAAGARLIAVDVGVNADIPMAPGIRSRKVVRATRNFLHGPAMNRHEALQGLEVGIAIVEEEWRAGLDLLATGDMGIGNTTAASAITAVLCKRQAAEVTGPGTGLSSPGVVQKVRVIEKAIETLRPDPEDPFDVLAKVGGLEIAGIAGSILGAAAQRIPVLLDGFICGAAALIATGLAPGVRPFLIAAHRSTEPGHGVILAHLGLRPLLELDLRLGEGTGAVLAMPIVEAAARILTEMATFEEAGVSNRPETE